MKKIMIALTLMLSCLILHAQSGQESVVAANVEALRVAILNADSVSLSRLTASALSYGHSTGVIENKQTFISTIASGKTDYTALEFVEQSISITGDVAVVRHTMNTDFTDAGKNNHVQLHVLQVWQKQGKEWKLLARQAIKLL